MFAFTILLPNSENEILELPSSIGELENLTFLNISNNRLLSLPDSMVHLKQLVVVDASFNKLSNLPLFFFSETLPALKELRLWGNKLSIPKELLAVPYPQLSVYLLASEMEKHSIYASMRFFAANPNQGQNPFSSKSSASGNHPELGNTDGRRRNSRLVSTQRIVAPPIGL